MKIIISAYGKFDLFRWAEGFEKKGLLFRLLTDFYSRKIKLLSRWREDREIIPPRKVRLFIWPRIFREITKWWLPNQEYLENVLFDWWASHQLKGSDLVIVRSSSALLTIKKAKAMGIRNILYRGSSHVVFRKNIINEEYARWGIKPKNRITPSVINRELEEYADCSYLYTPSTYAAKTYVEKGVPKEKIISFPLSAENIEGGPANAQKEKGSKFKVMYVGAISLEKGVQYLLEAMRLVRASHPRAELVLIGSLADEFKPFLKKYQNSFDYRGVVPHHEIGRYYNEASVFVFPSIDDGFGQVILEAMSFGLPVIATTNCAGPDIINDGKNGFIVPVRDPQSIAAKISQLYENQVSLEEMARQAKAEADKHSIMKFIDNWIDFFKEKDWLN